MYDFDKMMADISIRDIENEVMAQLSAVKDNPDRMKLSLVMYVFIRECMAVLKGIDTDAFVPKLQEDLNGLISEYSGNLIILQEMSKMHFETAKQLESSACELNEIDRKVKELLNRYEEELQRAINMRDESPL